jgi:hypothetical protein
MLNDLLTPFVRLVLFKLSLVTGEAIYQWAHGGCDRSAENSYSSMAPDPTFTFARSLCCPTLDFVYDFLGGWGWGCNTRLTSQIDIYLN